jgi:hypothetical protein
MSFKNVSTGVVDYYVMGVYNGNASTPEMVDDDYAPPSTAYTVTLQETDPEGVQTERTETVETPPTKGS